MRGASEKTLAPGMSAGANMCGGVPHGVRLEEMVPGAESEGGSHSAFSSSGLDTEDESGVHNGGEIVARHEVSADESGSEYGGDGMANGDGGSKRRRGGRPVDVHVDEQKFLDRCNESPTPTNKDLMSEFGLKRRRVQHLKNKLGCGQKQSDMQAQHTALFENITNESLQTRWVCEDEGGDVLHRMTVPLAVKFSLGNTCRVPVTRSPETTSRSNSPVYPQRGALPQATPPKMGVDKVPPPRPSTAEPDHAPQTISETASLTPPRDSRPSFHSSVCLHILRHSDECVSSCLYPPLPHLRLLAST